MREVSMEDLRRLVAENCLLKIPVEQISEDAPLFGPEGLGLDSVDALQLVLAVEQSYGVPMTDAQAARQVMQSLRTLHEWLARQS